MELNIRSSIIGATLAAALVAIFSFKAPSAPEAYTWRQFSTIESVVPGGMGRSRMIISDQADQTIEKDLLNFYSLTGINFKNVANNDRLIVDNINTWTAEGWELTNVTTGVQSNDNNGIFITRYLFRKPA
ncbi:MAG: hypothetical protein IPO90_14420 [Flavobacteriales bacterium]|nr:hypothetical protein [Flavobacteriales bacterium]MBL0045014.1 hypothetical protein [Flavobacteriales bacterium]